MYKIGTMSQIVGYSVETIRHYERIGLIDMPVRTESGQRIYNQNHVDMLRLIKAFRKIDVSLKDISEAIRHMDNKKFCKKIEILAEKYSEMLVKKRNELEDCERELEKLKKKCTDCSNKTSFDKKICQVIYDFEEK